MAFLNHAMRAGVVLTLIFGAQAHADDIEEITWLNLLPEGTAQFVPPPVHGPGNDSFPSEEESDAGFPAQSLAGGVVEDYNDKLVKLPGFVVPLEYSNKGKITEFLLVPYFGACIHYPPPPHNQIVYVVLDEPVALSSIWDPVWAVGTFRAETRGSYLATAGYTMAGLRLEEYEY
ncbi:MAG: DUF3299 domain-containing protein [Woeseiaceae bacterium]|nr:DUF3299 domain-containing protein [Woeseiaceae bacterium]